MDSIFEQAKEITQEVIEIAGLKKGDLFAVGCSSSEIGGNVMGTNSSMPIAKQVFEAIYSVTQEKGIFLAAQCCEHLNRAIIVEEEYVQKHGIDEVNVRPQPKAGGSFATCAYESFVSPVAVESVRANAGIDIGGVLIGMHIKSVAVPIKLSHRKIGEAMVIGARSRPKFIGGERAHYNEKKM